MKIGVDGERGVNEEINRNCSTDKCSKTWVH